jgi:hypothetical protein
MMKTITVNTLIPISLVISIVGGVAWLTKLYFTTEATAQTVIKVERTVLSLQTEYAAQNLKNQKEIYEKLNEINQRLSRLEVNLRGN